MGGGEISLSELIQKSDHNRFESLIVVPAQDEIFREYSRLHHKVEVAAIPSLKEKGGLAASQAIAQMKKTFKQNPVHVIHANGSRVCFYCSIVGRLLGIPVVWHVRESTKDWFLYDGLLGMLSTSILCVSKSVTTKRFHRFGIFFRDKLRVIYNGVDTQTFVPDSERRRHFRNKLGILDSDMLFGLVGNIVQRKRQDFFLRSLARAQKKSENLSVKVVIAGRPIDTRFLQKLKSIVSDNGLEDCVHFLDFIDTIHNLYPAFDIFVLTSESEGFPRSVIEAMSCGLPILGSDIPEIREAVRDPENGTLVPLNNIEEMASAIVRMSTDIRRLQAIGHVNRQKAMKKFSIACHVQEVGNLHVQLLRRKRNSDDTKAA